MKTDVIIKVTVVVIVLIVVIVATVVTVIIVVIVAVIVVAVVVIIIMILVFFCNDIFLCCRINITQISSFVDFANLSFPKRCSKIIGQLTIRARGKFLSNNSIFALPGLLESRSTRN